MNSIVLGVSNGNQVNSEYFKRRVWVAAESLREYSKLLITWNAEIRERVQPVCYDIPNERRQRTGERSDAARRLSPMSRVPRAHERVFTRG